MGGGEWNSCVGLWGPMRLKDVKAAFNIAYSFQVLHHNMEVKEMLSVGLKSEGYRRRQN